MRKPHGEPMGPPCTETHVLLVGYTHAEQAWVVEELERWLGR